MKLRTIVAAAFVAGLFARVATAQDTLSSKQLNGEWRGTLVLDNSSPQLVLEFTVTDATFAGKVWADGDLMGPMEHGTRDHNRVHFNVGRFDFTGVVIGGRMKIDLIVYNGSTRSFTATKVAAARDSTGARSEMARFGLETEIGPGSNRSLARARLREPPRSRTSVPRPCQLA